MEPLKKQLTLLLRQGDLVYGNKDVEILHLANHTRDVIPGTLFIAKTGAMHEGKSFITQAIERGAIVVVTDTYDPSHRVTQVVTQDIAALEAYIAAQFYENPTHQLFAIGVTGTNGKTTSTYLIRHLLQKHHVGLLGTVEWNTKATSKAAYLTTPDILLLQRFWHQMKQAGCHGGVMEVSSHGLMQERVRGLAFDIALFTNLTQDHLDYHETVDAYALAKARLFASLHDAYDKGLQKCAVINIDAAWADLMCQQAHVPILSYGFHQKAKLQARHYTSSVQGSTCDVCYQEKQYSFSTPLLGKFNIYNCLGALGVAIAMGYLPEELCPLLACVPQVPGRLERIAARDRHIFVDYAHTEDALRNVLETLRPLTQGRLFCLFGCGGDRDRTKRPKMGRIVEKLADVIIVTSDNPRSEDPEQIIRDILQGMQDPKRAYVCIDREEAICHAISQLSPQDVLLIAGKGHETTQVFTHKTVHFDDRIIAKQYV